MTQVVLWFQYQLSRNSSDLWGLVSKARERARARALWRSPWTQPRINLKWCLYIGFNKKNRDASINTSKNIWAWFEFLILIPVETIWRGGEFGGNPWIHLSGVRVYWHEQKLVLASSLPHCIFITQLRLRIRQGRCGLATSLRPTLWMKESLDAWDFTILKWGIISSLIISDSKSHISTCNQVNLVEWTQVLNLPQGVQWKELQALVDSVWEHWSDGPAMMLSTFRFLDWGCQEQVGWDLPWQGEGHSRRCVPWLPTDQCGKSWKPARDVKTWSGQVCECRGSIRSKGPKFNRREIDVFYWAPW